MCSRHASTTLKGENDMKHSIKLVLAVMFLAGMLSSSVVLAEEAPAATAAPAATPAATPAAAPAAKVAPAKPMMKLRVLGFITELGGSGRLYIFDNEKDYNDFPKAKKIITKKVASMKKMTAKNEDGKEQAVWYVMLKDLEPGTYAISVIHDENDDKKMNQVMGFGPPTEGVGASYATGGQPKWKTSKFELKAGDKIKHDIWVKYIFD
jgi:uncharacterized protein (DUF2141 family)